MPIALRLPPEGGKSDVDNIGVCVGWKAKTK